MESFLIIKTSALGDVIQTFPVLEYIKNRFPNSRVDWVVEKSGFDLVSSHPDMSSGTVFRIDSKAWRKSPFSKDCNEFFKKLRSREYSAIFDLQGNCKSGIITMLAKAKDKIGFGFKTIPEWPNILSTRKRFNPPTNLNAANQYLFITQSYFNFGINPSDGYLVNPIKLMLNEADKEKLNIQINKLKPLQRPILMICVGSKWSNKMLSKELWGDVLAKTSRYSFLVLWNSRQEKEIADYLKSKFCERCHTLGDVSLPLIQNLSYLMSGIISVDSALLHLCAISGVKTFGIFGPSLGQIYAPKGTKYFQASCPYGKRFKKRCPKLRVCKSGSCLKNISAQEVYDELSILFNST